MTLKVQTAAMFFTVNDRICTVADGHLADRRPAPPCVG
jgi:hypothetical protein